MGYSIPFSRCKKSYVLEPEEYVVLRNYISSIIKSCRFPQFCEVNHTTFKFYSVREFDLCQVRFFQNQ